MSLRNKNKQVVIRNLQYQQKSSSYNKNRELHIAEIEDTLHNWSIPVVKKSEVYKQHRIWSISQDEVHVIEYSYPGTKNNQTINLLEQEILYQHIKEGYNFIHLGLIQVAAKPNYRLGINSPILMILRDIRLKRFNDSIIAILESNLHDGPAFFNCYPNFSMDLKNDKTSNAIKLHVKLPDDIVDELHLVDSATINLDLRGIDTNNTKVARPVYSEKSESPQYSPTASQVLNTLTQETPFEIDKKWIRKDFNAEYNKEQRDWYFTTFSKEQTEKFREMYYAYMNRKEINVYSFDWFSRHCKKNIIDYPFGKQISTIGRVDNNWKTLDNKVIRAEYSPQQGIKIELENLEIEASPYKDIKKDLDKSIEKSDIKKLHSQMNYSNIVLEVMTKQLGRIETLNQVENASSSTTTKEINKLKAYPKLRNYYPRPSLADVQYEERGDLVQNSFSGNEISEWNLDGMSEQAILDLNCQMTMVVTAHRTKCCLDKSATLAIIQGFTGQLKGWWNNLCTKNDRLTILNNIKNETNQEDVVSTLIYTIIQNFIGDPNVFKNRAANQLTNLYCPTMSDYRWYKDTFLSKVTLREDGFANFWKEKFIAGLPKLFLENVRMNLEIHYGQPIAYESLTYGQLHNIIVCTDFKLQNKIRKESASRKKELGTFYHQYGVETMRTPSARHKKKQKQERSYNRSYKQYRKSVNKRKRVSNKNQNPIAENKQREVKCWKCGKVGHYANKCKVIQKINKLEDETLKKNLLNILVNSDNEETSSEELEESEDKLELEQIETLSTSSSSSKEEKDGYCLRVGICSCNDCKTISTLTKDQTFVLINIINKLEESSLKDEFIRQLNDLIIKDENSRKKLVI
ncbi:hypothetical protein CR513_31080, partial [Mucuna pruriens]